MKDVSTSGGVLLFAVAVCVCMPALSAQAVPLSSSYITPDGRELGLVFADGSGLSGQAIFYLLAGDQSIEILLTNTSTAIPPDPNFDSPADQLLTSLYFDLGGCGLNGSDPLITGGGAWVAVGSTGVGKDNPYDEGDDISTLWGYGNYQYDPPLEFLPPNFTTTLEAHATAFVFTKPGILDGPSYGAISSLNLLGGHDAGVPSISDTVRLLINLDRTLTSLACIVAPGNYTPHIEFGSDYRFIPPPPPPPPPPPIIPEPWTAAGLAMGIVGLAGYVRRRRA